MVRTRHGPHLTQKSQLEGTLSSTRHDALNILQDDLLYLTQFFKLEQSLDLRRKGARPLASIPVLIA